MDDIAQTFNTPTPVVYGGTGATDAAGARAALGLTLQAWELIETRADATVGSVSFIGLSAFRKLRVTGYMLPATDNVGLLVRTSTNNGSSYTSANYPIQQVIANSASVTATEVSGTGFLVSSNGVGIGNAPEEGIAFELLIQNFNVESRATFQSTATQRNASDAQYQTTATGYLNESIARNAIRFLFSAGNVGFSNITIEGIRG